MYTNQDIADYYNHTQNHYQNWWRLNKHLSLHYGIWEHDNKRFSHALQNTNHIMANRAGITHKQKILDAGCGVGGAAMYLAQRYNVRVKGVSLSNKQIKLAKDKANARGLSMRVQFETRDFTQTGYADEYFDVVWACESVCHAPIKRNFTDEAFRVLKPGGRLVLFDIFIAKENQQDPNNFINKWKNTWGVPAFSTAAGLAHDLRSSGFVNIDQQDYTAKVYKSAKRLYNTSIWGAVPAEFYNLFFPNAQRWAKNRYQSGYYQYKALKKGLWNYILFYAEKPR